MPFAALPPLPTPIAPARPVANTIPVTMNGITGNLDQFGNILNAAGQQIGVVPNSVAAGGTPTTTSVPTFQNGNLVVGNQTYTPEQVSQMGTNIATGKGAGGITDWLLSHEQDFVVVIVGIILIAAGLFSFKQTQNVIQTGGKIGRRVAAFAAA